MLIDSHCHLDRLKVSPQEALEQAKQVGLQGLMCIGVEPSTFIDVVQLAETHKEVCAAIGIHPLHVDDSQVDQFHAVTEAASHSQVVAIGETGLDYHYEKDEGLHERQRESFRQHLELSSELSKPVVIHTRAAQRDTLDMVERYTTPKVAGVLHCFTEEWEMAEAAIGMGFMISISGIVTFRNADALREVARRVPLEHLLIETDAPWLAPVPHRGKENLPAYVRDVAAYVADLRGIPLQALLEATNHNFRRVFGQRGLSF